MARLDERHIALARVVDEIKDNHLVHIANDIKELQAGQTKTNLKIAYWAGSVGTVLAILQVVLKFIK